MSVLPNAKEAFILSYWRLRQAPSSLKQSPCFHDTALPGPLPLSFFSSTSLSPPSHFKMLELLGSQIRGLSFSFYMILSIHSILNTLAAEWSILLKIKTMWLLYSKKCFPLNSEQKPKSPKDLRGHMFPTLWALTSSLSLSPTAPKPLHPQGFPEVSRTGRQAPTSDALLGVSSSWMFFLQIPAQFTPSLLSGFYSKDIFSVRPSDHPSTSPTLPSSVCTL